MKHGPNQTLVPEMRRKELLHGQLGIVKEIFHPLILLLNSPLSSSFRSFILVELLPPLFDFLLPLFLFSFTGLFWVINNLDFVRVIGVTIAVAVIVIPVLLGLITFRWRDVNAADDTDIETQLGRRRLRSMRTLLIE